MKRTRLNVIGFFALTVLLVFCFVFGGSFPIGEGNSLAVFSQEEFTSLPSLGEEALSAMASSADHAALLDAEGNLLWGKDAHTSAGMASTTKIMTALLAAEHIEQVGEDALTVVSETAAGIEGSSVYLKVGETVRLIDLLYATLLASANDAAASLAEAVAETQASFVDLMNDRAQEWGLVSTHFANPHGLADAAHYTTAYELGVIASYALQNELFARVARTKSYTFVGEGITRSLSNHNRMLSSYEGALGVKTGFTKATGRCLVSAAEREGVTLIAVTLSAPNDWQDHAAMLDYGFSILERRVLLEAGDFSASLAVVGGNAASVAVTNEKELSIVLPKGYQELTYQIELSAFAYAPISQGDVVGYAVVYDKGRVIAFCELTAKEAVDAVVYEKTLSEWILSFFGLR